MPETHPPHKMAFGPLAILSIALFIIIIDTTLLNVSLRSIITDLGSNIQQIQWVITVYSLILAAFTITGGRLGDIFGRKKMFLLGAVIFAVGSALAAASRNFGMLLAGEAIIEGLGAALMMPATSSLLLLNYHGRERAIAFSVWGGIAGAAAAIGPILGGYLTTNYSWRYGFLINVFVVIGLLAFSKYIKDNNSKKENLTIDWGGVVLSSLSLLSMVFGFIEASTYGWWQEKTAFIVGSTSLQIGHISVTPIALGLGLIGLILFAFWEVRISRKGRTPLLTLDLFANKRFMAGILALFAVSLALTGFIFLLPVFYQSVLNLDAFHSGLANLPLSLALLVVAPLAAILSKKIAPKHLVITGMALTTIAVYWVSQVFNVNATVWTFTPGLLLFGAGMGLVQSQINNLTLSAVPISEAGEASGLSTTTRQLGSTLGSAILGTVLLAAIPLNMHTGVQNSTVLPDQAKPAISQALETAGNNVEFESPSSETNVQNPAVGAEVQRIVKQAISDADSRAAGFATLFVLAGVFVSFGLPKRPAIQKRPDEVGAVVGH